jgi:hypothetical protein
MDPPPWEVAPGGGERPRVRKGRVGGSGAGRMGGAAAQQPPIGGVRKKKANVEESRSAVMGL